MNTARPCLYHPERRAQRRGLCWSCHKKFRCAGVTMPPLEAPGRAPWTPAQFLLAWVASLPPETLLLLHQATAPRSEAA